ncbi:MAG: hypothetical protein JKY98_12990 [Gammaproteobacteria bacterium]|nr:hypothetical protein [Gammaproteobacteria bacterium]
MREANSGGQVNIVVALACEARPLITHFKLKRQSAEAGFAMYTNNQGINLLVSGMGNLAMATACGFLAGKQSTAYGEKSAWLNIGIAGHQHVAIGEILIVHKVIDSDSSNTYYPPLMLEIECKTTSLISAQAPEGQYVDDSAYDMEAAAFYKAASRFATSELVQIAKIVSDNRGCPTEHITETKIQNWISENVAVIGEMVQQLLQYSEDYNVVYSLPEEYRTISKKVHLTASQKTRLAGLYRRFYALGGSELIRELNTKDYVSAKSLIRTIELLIESL